MKTTKEASKLNILDNSNPADPGLSDGELERLARDWVELVLNCLQYGQSDGLNSEVLTDNHNVPLS